MWTVGVPKCRYRQYNKLNWQIGKGGNNNCHLRSRGKKKNRKNANLSKSQPSIHEALVSLWLFKTKGKERKQIEQGKQIKPVFVIKVARIRGRGCSQPRLNSQLIYFEPLWTNWNRFTIVRLLLVGPTDDPHTTQVRSVINPRCVKYTSEIIETELDHKRDFKINIFALG